MASSADETMIQFASKVPSYQNSHGERMRVRSALMFVIYVVLSLLVFVADLFSNVLPMVSPLFTICLCKLRF